jgi:hypothetical protein
MRLRRTLMIFLGILAVGSVYLAWQGWQAFRQGWWFVEIENSPAGVPSGKDSSPLMHTVTRRGPIYARAHANR